MEKTLYEPTEQEICQAAAILVEVFGGHYGFPDTEGGLRMFAKGLCRIVWFLPHSEIMKIVCPREPGKWKPHHIVGETPDHEWLMEEALAVCQRFPTLIELRRLHDRWVINRDGREWEEMELR